jgi:hypothetical protein
MVGRGGGEAQGVADPPPPKKKMALTESSVILKGSLWTTTTAFTLMFDKQIDVTCYSYDLGSVLCTYFIPKSETNNFDRTR